MCSPIDTEGILRLTASEMKKYPGFTNKVKILGKGGDIRIYGKELENGHIVFSLKSGH